MTTHKWTIRYVPSQMQADIRIEPPVNNSSGFSLSMVGPQTFELLKVLIHEVNSPNHWKSEIIRLSHFLRERFPEEVEKNIAKPTEESSAVDLVFDLLGRVAFLVEEPDKCICGADGFNPMCPTHRPEGWSPR